MNPEGMWLLTINPESIPAGYSVLPGEVTHKIYIKNRKDALKMETFFILA